MSFLGNGCKNILGDLGKTDLFLKKDSLSFIMVCHIGG